jgi:hypothetical protein
MGEGLPTEVCVLGSSVVVACDTVPSSFFGLRHLGLISTSLWPQSAHMSSTVKVKLPPYQHASSHPSIHPSIILLLGPHTPHYRPKRSALFQPLALYVGHIPSPPSRNHIPNNSHAPNTRSQIYSITSHSTSSTRLNCSTTTHTT